MGAPSFDNLPQTKDELHSLAREFEHLHWLQLTSVTGSHLNEDLMRQLIFQCHWEQVRHDHRWYLRAKNIVDRIGAMVALILLSPMFLVIALAIKVDSPGPVFFRQLRAGRSMTAFRIFKFRTMYDGSELRKADIQNTMSNRLFKNERDERITPVGRWLRTWSLDELPQLINIAAGSMSLVGPRPLAMEDSATIPHEHYLRFAVKPGLTGLWQATIRHSKDGLKKIALDAEYVRKMGPLLDLLLLFRTIGVVLRRDP